MPSTLALAAVIMLLAQAETQHALNCRMAERTNGYAGGAIKAAEVSIEAAEKVCKKKGNASQACKASLEVAQTVGDFAKRGNVVADAAEELCKKP